MKSFINLYVTLYDGLVKDVVATYPTLAAETQKDYTRLLKSIEHEGLGFLTFTHGSMEKAFLQCLSQKKRLGDFAGLVRGFSAKSSEDVRPCYLHGLFTLIFDSDGTLKPNAEINAIAFVRQWLSMAKKAAVDCTPERVDDAIREWVVTDESLPQHFPGTWDEDHPTWVRHFGHPLYRREPDDELPLFPNEKRSWRDIEIRWSDFQELCTLAISDFGIFEPWDIRPKHGPGATADQVMGLKYEFPTWSRKLQSVFPWDFFASADLGYWKTTNGREPLEREIPCVMYAVPKTQDAPRLIAAEPTCNQWIQGGIRRFLEQGVAASPLRRCINFRDQGESQRLALEGSRDDTWSTVDLSSASDRLSSRLVEYVFQCNPALLDALQSCRSRLIKLPDGTYHRLRKFAPQGSAVTFPVQTIIFTLLSLFAVMLTKGCRASVVLRDHTDLVQVFGDDIIIPGDSYKMLADLLTTLKLKVNESKSFSSGKFREACGMDAYDGHDVTPVRVRRPYSGSDPTSLESVVNASNNLFDRGYWHTSAALLKTVPEAERKLMTIGAPDGGAVSLTSFCGSYTGHLKQRWNDEIHKEEVRCITVKSKTAMQHGDGDSGLVQFFFEEPDPLEKYQSGQPKRNPKTKKVARFV
jgi:hypothetical protein